MGFPPSSLPPSLLPAKIKTPRKEAVKAG